jgi:hypothetical protein
MLDEFMERNSFPSPVDFLISTSLYKAVHFGTNEVDDVLNIIYFNGTYDAHCPECAMKSIFQGTQVRSSEFMRAYITHNRANSPATSLVEEGPHVIEAVCTRNKKHIQRFCVLVQVSSEADPIDKSSDTRIIQKIGQHPSYGDAHIAILRTDFMESKPRSEGGRGSWDGI